MKMISPLMMAPMMARVRGLRNCPIKDKRKEGMRRSQLRTGTQHRKNPVMDTMKPASPMPFLLLVCWMMMV